MQTQSISTEEARERRKWLIVDAQDQVLGRLASQIAHVLRGKHQVYFTPHVDTGDFVVVVNAEKIKLTGSKMDKKVYQRHTGWVGGIVERTAKQLLAEKPEEVLSLAVKRMLPKGPLGRAMFAKLKVYAGDKHPHVAQQPQVFLVAS